VAWKITIAGVDRTTSIDQKAGVDISMERNERGTATFTTISGYFPDMRSEVIIYDTDGTTPIFGGIIYSRRTKGIGLLTKMQIECVDWSIYLSWRTVSHTFTGVVSLIQVLQELVNNYLSDYGITLSGTQATGPSIDATGYTWTYKTIDEALRDVTTYLGGYSWSITPAKVFEAILSSTAPAAPYTITDANSHVQLIDWAEDSQEYATRVIMVCGGNGTAELSQTWTLSSGDISTGYVTTDVPSLPTTGVSATVNGTPRSIGGSGSELIWDWSLHRVSAGSFIPNVGDVLVVNYTGQYPFIVTADAGVTPPIEIKIDAPEVTTVSSANDMIASLLARYYQQPKKFQIETPTFGFRPGQALSINSTVRGTGSVTALIVSVRITLVSDGFWKHTIEAATGVFQSGRLDYFRSLNGVPPIATFTTGINPGSITSVLSGIVLGGSRSESVVSSGPAYKPVPNYIPFTALSSFSGQVRVDLWARNSGISCTARLLAVGGSAVGTSSPITSQTATPTTFPVTITGGVTYHLEIVASAANEGVYGIGTLESV